MSIYMYSNIENRKLTLIEWNTYITYKKTYILNTILKPTSLENSEEYKSFIKTFQTIINYKIFNISHILFLVIKLLEDSYLDSSVVNRIINNDTTINPTTINPTTINDTPDTTNLKTIIQILIENVIYIDISLNIHCVLIVYFLKKLENISNTSRNMFNKFDAFDAFDNHIKPSTLILLFLKLIHKIDYTINPISIPNPISILILNIKKTVSIKMKQYLDTFMIDINQTFINYNVESIYKICTTYIFLIIDLLYNELFYNIFNVLDTYILTHINKKDSFDLDKYCVHMKYIKTTIKTLLDIEITNIKERFS